MDSELFTVGGKDYDGGADGIFSKINMTTHGDSKDNDGVVHRRGEKFPTATIEAVHYQKVKTSHAMRWVLNAVFILLVIGIVYSLFVIIPMVIPTWKRALGIKEGLQYLGASTSVVRDDLGWPTNDSLAEKAMRNQNRITPEEIPAVVKKAQFTSRNDPRSPEEELLAQQKK